MPDHRTDRGGSLGMMGRVVTLQHLRQIGADRAARVAVAASALAGAVLGHIGREGEELFIWPVAHDQIGEPVAARASAFRALDPQQVELADQIAEDDRAVSGHYRSSAEWSKGGRGTAGMMGIRAGTSVDRTGVACGPASSPGGCPATPDSRARGESEPLAWRR